MNDGIPVVEVMVSVAVSDSGKTECCICNSNYVQDRSKYAEWDAEKRSDKNLWHIKTVKVRVPLPASYEDLSD